MTELVLRSKELKTLDQDTISEYASTCTKLDLTENSISSFGWLKQFTSLKTLIVDNNSLGSLKEWPQCPTVDTLWLNNNRFKDIRSLMDQISRLFPNLTYLSVLRNPCTPDMYFSEDEGEAYQRFRYYVIYRLQTLSMLDATPVEEEELDKARRGGQSMVAARPDNQDSDSDDDQTPAQQYSVKNVIQTAPEPKVSTFLLRLKPRYDGSNSEGNRFITNDDL